MSSKTKAPTKEQVKKALWDYIELAKQYETSDKRKKSKKIIRLETEIARARVLQMDCQRTAGQLFNVIHDRLPSKDLQELLGLYSILKSTHPQISKESYNIFRNANSRAKRLIGLAPKPSRRTK